jgi:hypothetical protein
VRPLQIISEAARDLLVSGASAVLLYISVQELIRHPGSDSAMFSGLLPITVHKAPWVLVIVAVLLALWLQVRALSGPRDTLWKLRAWLARVGFWWSVAALVLFAGVAAYGAATRRVAELNWRFVLGYMALTIPLLLGCGYARRRAMRFERDRHSSPAA